MSETWELAFGNLLHLLRFLSSRCGVGAQANYFLASDCSVATNLTLFVDAQVLHPYGGGNICFSTCTLKIASNGINFCDRLNYFPYLALNQFYFANFTDIFTISFTIHKTLKQFYTEMDQYSQV